MSEFVVRENINMFRKLLAIEIEPANREVLQRLLAEEEAKLRGRQAEDGGAVQVCWRRRATSSPKQKISYRVENQCSRRRGSFAAFQAWPLYSHASALAYLEAFLDNVPAGASTVVIESRDGGVSRCDMTELRLGTQ